MKKVFIFLRRFLLVIAFLILFLLIVNRLSDIVVPKNTNRYYILQEYLKEHPEENRQDVMVFGSCHAYTSFNPLAFQQNTGLDAFVYANPSEIIPVTYLRMKEQFKRSIPKAAVVEIWGINPYETYINKEELFGDYLSVNLENVSFSPDKLELIRDYEDLETIDYLPMISPIFTYRSRFLDGSLKDADFHYSFAGIDPGQENYYYDEMKNRLEHKGYKSLVGNSLEDYPRLQSYVDEDDCLDFEPDILKYLEKIIDLCEKKGVELIFYRAPYVSSKNELRKVNRFCQFCSERDIPFINLEEEISFAYQTDFNDYQHLSACGAEKATNCLSPYILQAVK